MFTLVWDDSGETAPLATEIAHASTIRRIAIDRARESGRAIRVLRAGRVAYVIMPDGNVRPPADAKVAPREDCHAGQDERPCFCSACRAIRRSAR